MSTNGYTRYELSGAPGVLSFLYPSGWRLRATAQGNQMDVHILGPRNRANTYSTSLALSVTTAAGKSARAAAEEMLAAYRSALHCQTEGPTSVTVAGVSAQRVDIVQAMPLPPNSLDAQETLIHERSIFFRWRDALFEARYAAPQEDFDDWLAAFDALLRSLVLLAPPDDQNVLPTLAPAPALVVAEERAAYRTQGSEEDDQPPQHSR
jgi:hypothetical protein